MVDLQPVALRYRSALRDFVTSRSESALQAAYEAGRTALAAGWGVLDMIRLHLDAQAELLAPRPPGGAWPAVEETMRAACAFLAESLSPFEMAHRGFREAYATVRQSEARYRSLVDNAPYGIGRCRQDGRFTSANPALVRMLGYGSETELAQAPAPCPTVPRALLGTGEQARAVEVEWLRKDGKPMQVRLTARPVVGNSGVIEGAEVMAEDVTERRALEERLQLAQKMEAVGQLAGGIAHDFNNFITGITLCTNVLARGLPDSDPRRRQVEEIDLAATRASLLTQRLLAFARRQVVQPRVLDLNTVVTGLAKLLRPLLGANIKLVTSLSPEPCNVHADGGQMEQVILNLTVNARDAMPGGGAVTIETKRTPPPGPDQPGGTWVSLTVSDTGVGMDQATQARMFEPFFTTKELGHGTGLGLSTVYGIVTQAGGQVRVDSAPGQGSRFTVLLPLTTARRESPAGLRVAPEPERASGTILLAEDDEIVSHGVRQALEEAGYTVLVTMSGEEALALVRGRTGPLIPLLITDLVMPGMGGRALAEHFLTLNPEGHVLYISGYAGEAMVRRGLSVPDAQFLQKPFSAETLVRKVAEILGSGLPRGAGQQPTQPSLATPGEQKRQ